jgi:hypothetical protein
MRPTSPAPGKTAFPSHHLSEMVRYRPEQVERLAGERWSWLLGTWVPRALENSLLTYGSRKPSDRSSGSTNHQTSGIAEETREREHREIW